jgi:hypothetical protein
VTPSAAQNVRWVTCAPPSTPSRASHESLTFSDLRTILSADASHRGMDQGPLERGRIIARPQRRTTGPKTAGTNFAVGPLPPSGAGHLPRLICTTAVDLAYEVDFGATPWPFPFISAIWRGCMKGESLTVFLARSSTFLLIDGDSFSVQFVAHPLHNFIR